MVNYSMRNQARWRVVRARRLLFRRLVEDALVRLPPAIQAMLDNVEIVVEDEPPDQHDPADDGADTLFGLYQGIPLTQRGTGYSMVMPDKISIYRGPIERACDSRAEMIEQIRVTVWHELAHHLGFEEDRIEELGLS